MIPSSLSHTNSASRQRTVPTGESIPPPANSASLGTLASVRNGSGGAATQAAEIISLSAENKAVVESYLGKAFSGGVAHFKSNALGLTDSGKYLTEQQFTTYTDQHAAAVQKAFAETFGALFPLLDKGEVSLPGLRPCAPLGVLDALSNNLARMKVIHMERYEANLEKAERKAKNVCHVAESFLDTAVDEALEAKRTISPKQWATVKAEALDRAGFAELSDALKSQVEPEFNFKAGGKVNDSPETIGLCLSTQDDASDNYANMRARLDSLITADWVQSLGIEELACFYEANVRHVADQEESLPGTYAVALAAHLWGKLSPGSVSERAGVAPEISKASNPSPAHGTHQQRKDAFMNVVPKVVAERMYEQAKKLGLGWTEAMKKTVSAASAKGNESFRSAAIAAVDAAMKRDAYLNDILERIFKKNGLEKDPSFKEPIRDQLREQRETMNTQMQREIRSIAATSVSGRVA